MPETVISLCLERSLYKQQSSLLANARIVIINNFQHESDHGVG